LNKSKQKGALRPQKKNKEIKENYKEILEDNIRINKSKSKNNSNSGDGEKKIYVDVEVV